MKKSIKQYFEKPEVKAFLFGGLVFLVLGAIVQNSTLFSGNMGVQYDADMLGESMVMPVSRKMSNSAISGADVSNSMESTRTVTRNSLSIHVESVEDFHNSVAQYVSEVSGKIMDENRSVSTEDKSESGTMTVFIPNNASDSFLKLIENKSIKVVNRQINSYEISQEYADIDRSIASYENTYKKLQSFYDNANTVEELLEIQRSLDQAQRMIDSLKGRQRMLTEMSENTQYTLYSDTNELDLPYVPSGIFEFSKTFKMAVRSLMQTLNKVTTFLIYTVVNLPIIAALLLCVWLVKKYILKK